MPPKKKTVPKLKGLKPLGLFAPGNAVETAIEGQLAELMAHYGIPQNAEDRWKALAIGLAVDFVKGFGAEAKERQRPTKWNAYQNGVLVVEIERLTSKGHTVIQATAILAKKEPWRSGLSRWDKDKTFAGSDPAGALRKQYGIAKNLKIANVTRDAFKYRVEELGDISGWEKAVLDCFKAPEGL